MGQMTFNFETEEKEPEKKQDKEIKEEKKVEKKKDTTPETSKNSVKNEENKIWENLFLDDKQCKSLFLDEIVWRQNMGKSVLDEKRWKSLF